MSIVSDPEFLDRYQKAPREAPFVIYKELPEFTEAQIVEFYETQGRLVKRSTPQEK